MKTLKRKENRRVAETLRRYVQQRVRAAQGNRAVRSSVRDDAGTDGVYLFFRRGENWNGGV